MKIVIRILKRWLPLAIATAGCCGLAYLLVQQSLRIGANDPQIQMAEDTANALENGESIDSLVPATKVDIASSLAPFIMLFDNSGNVLASSAVLHGTDPALPSGVLDYTRQNIQDRVTWQPENEVRIAAVMERYDEGFVLVGRSLREVEKRTIQAGQITGLALLAIWTATLVVVIIGELVWRNETA